MSQQVYLTDRQEELILDVLHTEYLRKHDNGDEDTANELWELHQKIEQ